MLEKFAALTINITATDINNGGITEECIKLNYK